MESIQRIIGKQLKEKGLTVSTAESCTGGGIAARLTSVAGSSAYVRGGIVAYQNDVKVDLLGVNADTIYKYGVVSEETVVEMVKGAMKSLKTDCAMATTGIAGPGGEEPGKPVGTIWIAAAVGDSIVTMRQEGDEGRRKNIERAIQNALKMLLQLLKR
ncbi:MAG: CinA family protein [Bacteroidaceae bacterium]|nr:CinA family protein [Bacteroidaceae bacterium]MBR1542399.1 CinA family protein [Bacteroidaceae bacterium]